MNLSHLFLFIIIVKVWVRLGYSEQTRHLCWRGFQFFYYFPILVVFSHFHFVLVFWASQILTSRFTFHSIACIFPCYRYVYIYCISSSSFLISVIHEIIVWGFVLFICYYHYYFMVDSGSPPLSLSTAYSVDRPHYWYLLGS